MQPEIDSVPIDGASEHRLSSTTADTPGDVLLPYSRAVMIPITDLFRYAVIAFPLLVGIACSAKAIRIFRSNLVESGNVWATLKSHNRGALWLFSIGIIEGVSFVLNVLTYRSVKSNFLRVQS